MTSTNTVGPSDEVGAYPNGSTELGLNQWTVLSYAYALLCVVGLGYFLFDSPIQVSDGFTNLAKAANGTLGSLVYSEFFQHGYLRPLLWGHTRVLFDLSSGHYFEWFRGWHVAQVALLSVLFVRLVRPRTLLAAAVLIGALFAWRTGRVQLQLTSVELREASFGGALPPEAKWVPRGKIGDYLVSSLWLKLLKGR